MQQMKTLRHSANSSTTKTSEEYSNSKRQDLKDLRIHLGWYFFMTSDGKWNQNNPLGNRFDQAKATCQLIPMKRNKDFSIINDDFSTIVENIRAIQNIANPHKSRDVSSFLIGNPPNIKIIHHLFVVSPRFYYITVQISLTHPTGKKFRL